MTLLEQLQSHRGGLLHLKTELFWYDGRGHDKDPGRICLLLDVITTTAARVADVEPITRTTGALLAAYEAIAVALLLIDGQPQWVWIAEQDVEVLNEAR
jgi:hypothetical protein